MGGGVAFLINDSINYTETDIANLFNEEIVGFTCKLINTTVSFFSYYNPPDKEININIFNYIQNNYINFLIMGDLNAKSLIFNSKKTNRNGSIIDSILLNNNCQIINESFEPTFHIIKEDKPDYCAFLDLLLGSPLIANIAYDYQIIKSRLDSCQALSFHSMIEIKISLNYSTTPNSNPQSDHKTPYLFDKADWLSFQCILESTNHGDNRI